MKDFGSINDISSARFSFQLFVLFVMFLVVMCFAYFFVFSGQLDSLTKAQNEELTLKEQYKSKKMLAVNRVALENQMKEIKSSFGVLLKQLPTKSEISSLLTEINQAGVGRGLQFDLFRPDAEIKGQEMAELPIHIKLSGSYQDLATFVSDVGQLSRIVTIGDITLVPEDKNNQRLSMEAVAKTYRALDIDEKTQKNEIKK